MCKSVRAGEGNDKISSESGQSKILIIDHRNIMRTVAENRYTDEIFLVATKLLNFIYLFREV